MTARIINTFIQDRRMGMQQIPEVTKREVEAKLASVGDYVKMDYLQQCLKKQLEYSHEHCEHT